MMYIHLALYYIYIYITCINICRLYIPKKEQSCLFIFFSGSLLRKLATSASAMFLVIRSWRFSVSLRISFDLPGLWPSYAGCRGQRTQKGGVVWHKNSPKTYAVWLLAFLILFHILISTLPATLLHFNKNTQKFLATKSCTRLPVTWAQAQLEQLAVHGKVPDEAILVGNLGRPRFATIFGCDRKFGILFWLLQKKTFGSWLHHQAISRYLWLYDRVRLLQSMPIPMAFQWLRLWCSSNF